MRDSGVTCQHDQGGQAGKGRHVQVKVLQMGREISDGVQPLAKPTKALEPVQNQPVAKNKLVLRQDRPAG